MSEHLNIQSKLYKRITKPFESNHWHCLQFPIIHLYLWQFPADTQVAYFLYCIFLYIVKASDQSTAVCNTKTNNVGNKVN